MEQNTVVMEDEDLDLVDGSAQSTHGDIYTAVPANSPAIGIVNWRHPKGDLADFQKTAECKRQFCDISGEMIARSRAYFGFGAVK